MNYASLMVYVDIEHPDASCLRLAVDLAMRFKARVIGASAASELAPLYFTDGFAMADVIEEISAQIDKGLAEAKQRFFAAFDGHSGRVEWRSGHDEPNRFLEQQCRAADLVVVGGRSDRQAIDPSRELNPGQFAIAAGRPVLVVPETVEKLDANCILIGWKDTRECRRAVFDALPLLQTSQRVVVTEVPEEEELSAIAQKNIADVVSWLKGHGISAEAMASPLAMPVAPQLEALAKKAGADLIVAGAYGHSRLREWIFGGVTREFLASPAHCTFMAH